MTDPVPTAATKGAANTSFSGTPAPRRRLPRYGFHGHTELLNGRVAMLGFAAALVGELLSGKGIVGQLAAVLHWYLG